LIYIKAYQNIPGALFRNTYSALVRTLRSEAMMTTVTTLDQLAYGRRAVVVRIGGERALRRRLLDMGLVTGETVTLTAVAPLGDPIELTVKGYRLSLRKAEARLVVVEPA
jgi:ferrous iron transport protein A